MAESDYNWSPYVYVDNNPMRYIDPTGMKKGDPDDPIQISEVIIHPSEPQKGDQVLPAESPLWNLLYALIGSREYTPTYKSTETSNGFDLKYGTYLVGTDGKIKGKKSNLVTGEPMIPTVGTINGAKAIKIIFSTKKDLKMLKFAQETFKGNANLSKEASNLLNQVAKGNLTPGLGSKSIGNGINELRSIGGARVYFRNTSTGIEVLGYSNKMNQQTVINYLKSIYK